MTLNEFLEHVSARKPLDTPEIGRFMNRMNNRARLITCQINYTYHTQEEIRNLMSRLTGKEIDPSFRLFPPFHTDFGRNVVFGRNVFVNAGCHFQDHGGIRIGDGCLIGHNVVFATLNHDFDPERRSAMHPAPIVLEKNVWIGSQSTILPGVTVGEGAVIAAGSVVTRNVEAFTVVAGIPAKLIRKIEKQKVS